MNRYRYLPSYHYDNTQNGTIYNPAEPQLRDYTIVSKQKRMVFPESTILEPQGWVKQEDGSWYVKYASTPYKKIIYDNTDNYSGQLFISYVYRYLDKTLIHQGAVIHIEYMDGTTEFLNTRITDEWTTVYNITKLGKPIKKLSWIHGTGSQSTWIKDIVIAKIDELDLLPEKYYYDDSNYSNINGVTYTVNDDRSVTGNGTIGTTSNESRFCFRYGDRVKPGKYLLYAKLDKVPNGSCVIWQFGKRTGSTVVNVKQVSVDTKNPMIIVDTTDIDYDSDNIFFYNKTSGTVLTNATCRPIFIDLSEEDNIIPPVYQTQSVGTVYDVQVNNNIDGTVTLNGQSTAGAYNTITTISKRIKIERGKRYLLTGCPKQTTTNYELVASFHEGNTAVGDLAIDIGNGTIFTAPDGNYDALWLYLLNVTPNYNYENVIIDPKIVCIDADFRYSGLGNKLDSMIDYSQQNEYTDKGITYTRQENGILCNGTATGTAYFVITKNIPLKKDHVYYLKTNIPDNHTGVDTYTTYQIYVEDNDSGVIVDGYTYDIRESGKYITALKDGNINCAIVTHNGYTHNSKLLTAEMYDVTNRDILSYPYQNATTTKNGIKFTDNGDGSITATGTATADTRFYMKGETVKLNYSGPIWICGCPKNSGSGLSFSIICSAYKYIEGVAKLVLSKRTTYADGLFDTGGKDYDFLELCIFVAKDITVTDLVFRPHAIMIFPYNDNYQLPIRTTYYENLINMSDFEQTRVQANEYYAGFIVQLTSDNIYKYFPAVNEARSKEVTIDFDIDNDRYKKELVVHYSEAVDGSYDYISFHPDNNFTNTLPNKIPVRFEFRARFQSKSAIGNKVKFSNFLMYNASSTDITTIERTSKLKNGFKLNKIKDKLNDVKLHPHYVNKVELLTDIEPDLFDISYYTYHNTNDIAYSGSHIDNSNGELRDLKIYGNTVYEDADTIPSPDKQNKMLSVGDKTINLFNRDDIADNRSLNFGTLIDNTNKYVSGYIDCTEIDSVSINKAGSFAWYNESKEVVLYENKSVTMFRNYSKPEGAKYLRLDFSKSDIQPEIVMCVAGSYTEDTMPEFEPYGKHKIPVEVSGNLLDKSLFNISAGDEYGILTDTGFILTSKSYSTTFMTAENFFACSGLKRGDKCRISYDVIVPEGTLSGSIGSIGFTRADGLDWLCNVAITASGTHHISRLFTLSTDPENYRNVVAYGCNGTLLQVEYKNLQITRYTDEVIPYQDYTKPKITNIYLDEPLRKVDKYADYIDFSRNIVVRNIGTIPVKALLGYSEHQTVYGYRCGHNYVTNSNKTDVYNTPNMCDYFKTINGGTISTNEKSDVIACRNEDLYTFISKERVDSAVAGKDFVNGLGAAMFYALEIPTETSIALPKIELNAGNNELVVNTSVKPSKIETMYVKE